MNSGSPSIGKGFSHDENLVLLGSTCKNIDSTHREVSFGFSVALWKVGFMTT